MQKYSIKQLRHLLINEPEFHLTHSYFFDWVDEHKNTALATPTKNKMLIQVVKESMKKLLSKTDITVSQTMMCEVKGVNLIHGSILVEGRLTVFFYFSDLDWGMISAVKLGSTHTDFVRFRMIAHSKLDFTPQNQDN
jgi:hypothetical protein